MSGPPPGPSEGPGPPLKKQKQTFGTVVTLGEESSCKVPGSTISFSVSVLQRKQRPLPQQHHPACVNWFSLLCPRSQRDGPFTVRHYAKRCGSSTPPRRSSVLSTTGTSGAVCSKIWKARACSRSTRTATRWFCPSLRLMRKALLCVESAKPNAKHTRYNKG